MTGLREARDLLLAHREDYEAARAAFRWPAPDEFNWALEWFDPLARGNDATGLWIAGADAGADEKLSFDQLARRPGQVARWRRGGAHGKAYLPPAGPPLGPGGRLAARAGRGPGRPRRADAGQPAGAVGVD